MGFSKPKTPAAPAPKTHVVGPEEEAKRRTLLRRAGNRDGYGSTMLAERRTLLQPARPGGMMLARQLG